MQLPRGALILLAGPVDLPRQLVGEKLDEQFDRGAPLISHIARALMVADNQPPELAILEDGHGHRRRHAHVAQVFQMNGGHRARDRQGQIERRAAGVGGRHERRDRAVHIGDQAQQAALVEFARLLGDIAGGVAQAQKRFHLRAVALGDHLAGTVRGELIDHNAIKTRQRLQRGGGLPAGIQHACRTLDPRQQRLNKRQLVALGGVDPGFELKHIGLAGDMDREVKQGAMAQHITGKNAGHAAGRADKLEVRAQRVHGPLREKLRQGPPDKGARVQLEQLRHIGRDVIDQKIKRRRYQAAIALHAAEQMDGFAVAFGQIDLC